MPENLGALVTDLERWLGVSLTIKDHAGLLVDHHGRAVFPERPAHTNWFCLYRRPETNRWRQQCLRHCNRDLPGRGEREREPFRCECWKGLQEVIVPVPDESGVGFLIYAGVFRSAEDPAFLRSRECPQEYRQRYRDLPLLTDQTAARIAQTLVVFGQGILQLVRRQQQEQPGTTGQIHRFIRENYAGKISLTKLAQALHLSASRVSHLVRELTGESFSDLLMAERIRRARNLLISSGMPLAEIARRTGFCNEYYLSRQFSRLCGTAPSVFRRQARQEPQHGA